jgi:hypothetical protein
LERDEIYGIDWESTDRNTQVGYVLEVDLEYPDYLHDEHNSYPLAAEKSKIGNDELSDYQIKILEEMKSVGFKRVVTEKLNLTFYKKTEYVLHYLNLKLYLKLGLKLIKIHRVLSFDQSRWLKPYIEYNSELRKNAKSQFEIDFYKLIVNSIYGKSIQNNRKHVNIKLALNQNQAKRWVSKPNYETFTIMNQNKAIIKMKKSTVKLDRPIYIGHTVLELSKLHMYHLHYNVFKNIYKHNIELLYTDTDSFIYSIKTDDFYADIKSHFKHLMDLSNFEENNEYFSEKTRNKNKKRIGCIKDELGGKIIKEFCGLKSKLYSIIYDNDKIKTTAKGLQRAVLKKFVNHNHYKSVIEKNNLYYLNMKRIQSKNHQIGTLSIKKLIYSPIDDKRYLLEDGINSLAYGHKDIV